MKPNNCIYIFICMFFFVLVSCGKHSHDHSNEQGHSHDTNLMISGYSNDYEVFAEAEPFALGKTSSVTLFLTDLHNFKPANVKSVTTSMIIGNKGIRQTVDTPISPGMFSFSLTPEAVGEGKLVFDIQTDKGSSQIEIPHLMVYEDAHKAEHVAEEENLSNPNAIAFTKAQSWRIDFATEKPVIEPFGQVIKTTAQIQSSQSDESVISAGTSGIIMFSGREITEGQSVASGQTLFSVSGSGLVDNNINVRFIEAQSNFQRAEADYKRAQELIKDNIVSQKDFLETKTAYETSKAVFENLQKNFNNQGQKVSSPIAGFIKQIFVSNGQYVEEGQALMSVSKNRTLLLKADVQPKYASLLPQMSTATIRSMDKKEVYSLDELNGRILSFGKSINESNYLIPVTFQIDNKAGFVSGGFVEMYLKTRSDKPVMTVPTSSLTEEQGVYFVFIQLTPESFEKREVNIGLTDGIRTEVISGLNPDERVVSRGAVSVKLAQSAGALDPHAGHVH